MAPREASGSGESGAGSEVNPTPYTTARERRCSRAAFVVILKIC